MIIGMEWKGDGGSWWDVQWKCRQKHNAETLWNYTFMEMHVNEIGIIVGAFYFIP